MGGIVNGGRAGGQAGRPEAKSGDGFFVLLHRFPESANTARLPARPPGEATEGGRE